MYHYRGLITRVIDGDTVEAEIDLGFGVSIHETIRLDGINTPEIRGGTAETKAAGQEAKRFVEKHTLDRQVEVFTHQDKKGKFGRYLAEIFLNGEDCLNDMLVRAKLAEAVDYS